MTTKQLEDRLMSIKFAGYGTYKVTFLRHGEEVTITTHDTMAIDRINDHKSGEVEDRECAGWYTYKQALQALWNEGKELA